MTTQTDTPTSEETDKELNDLLSAALEQPGVAEAVEYYERVERVYQNALSLPQPVEQTTNSANS